MSYNLLLEKRVPIHARTRKFLDVHLTQTGSRAYSVDIASGVKTHVAITQAIKQCENGSSQPVFTFERHSGWYF